MYELHIFVRKLRYLLLWIHKSDLKKELFGCDSFKRPQRTSGFHQRTGGSLDGYMYTCNTLMASTQIILFLEMLKFSPKKTFLPKKKEK